jgi:DDB1- and CUL4-associated factor 13
MDVDFSPTGKEFVAGSYDRSIRIFRFNSGHSHEVYTTTRMQRVFATCFTGDATYIVSGSDDFNLRIWKVWKLYLLNVTYASIVVLVV